MSIMKYHVEIVNYTRCKESEYIGRPSPLGNPFPIGPNADRDVVCKHYEEWFQERIELNDPIVFHELLRLHRIGRVKGVVRLGCFCKPKRCHGETIAHFLEHNFDLLEEMIR